MTRSAASGKLSRFVKFDSSAWKSPGGRAFVVAFLSCVALGVRLVGLGRQALWSDEMQRVTWAKGYEFDLVFDVRAADTGVRLPPRSLERALEVVSTHNPPLNGALLNLWLRLTGDPSDFVARLPSALFSAAAVPVTYLALRPRFGLAPALFAAALLALSPYHVYYAQEVNHYALGSFCVALSFYFYLRFEKEPAFWSGLGWALSATAGVYAHYYAGIVVLFQWLGLLLTAHARATPLTRVVWPPALMAALVLPYLPTLRGQMAEMTSTAQIGAFHAGDYFFERLRAIVAMPYVGELADYSTWGEALPVMALSVTLCTVALARVDAVDRRLLLVNLVGPLVFVVAAFFLRKANSILWPRYQLFFSFALFTCVGIGLAALRRTAVVAGIALLGLALLGDTRQQRIVREDWRTVASTIDRTAPGDPVLVYRQNLVYSVARYLHGDGHLFGIGPTPELERTLDVIVGSEAKAGIWYASAWPESSEMDDRVRAFLVNHYSRCDAENVDPGVVSLHLTRCSGLRTEAGDTPRWWLARPGPRLEGGWVETREDVGVRGWTFSSAGMRAVRVVLDGKTVAEVPHPGLGRPDVSGAFPSYPKDLTEPSGFFVPVHVGGAIRRARILGVRADGTTLELPGNPGR